MILYRSFGFIPAVAGSFFWLANLVIFLDGGNLAEEYSLLPQFIAIYLFYVSEKKGEYSWSVFVIGVTSGLCFLLKPNLVGIQLSIALLILFRGVYSERFKTALRGIKIMMLGAVSPLAFFSLYFFMTGSLSFFIDQFLLYNIEYSSTPIGPKVSAILIGLFLMDKNGFIVILLSGYCLGFLHILINRSKIDKTNPLIVLALIDMPIEFILVSVSGRSYNHYFMAWLPVTSILCAFFLYCIINLGSKQYKLNIGLTGKRIRLNSVVACLVLLYISSSFVAESLNPYVSFLSGSFENISINSNSSPTLAVNFIKTHTSENDYVLMWGSQARVNFISDRRSPTSFIYQQPIYSKPDRLSVLLQDLKDKRPRLIIDTSYADRTVPSFDNSKRMDFKSTREMDKIFEYVNENYVKIGVIGTDEWEVYERI